MANRICTYSYTQRIPSSRHRTGDLRANSCLPSNKEGLHFSNWAMEGCDRMDVAGICRRVTLRFGALKPEVPTFDRFLYFGLISVSFSKSWVLLSPEYCRRVARMEVRESVSAVPRSCHATAFDPRAFQLAPGQRRVPEHLRRDHYGTVLHCQRVLNHTDCPFLLVGCYLAA